MSSNNRTKLDLLSTWGVWLIGMPAACVGIGFWVGDHRGAAVGGLIGGIAAGFVARMLHVGMMPRITRTGLLMVLFLSGVALIVLSFIYG